ncbi:MAG: hypothetical protein U0R49_03020 [Fimbriimonadales bacterium]
MNRTISLFILVVLLLAGCGKPEKELTKPVLPTFCLVLPNKVESWVKQIETGFSDEVKFQSATLSVGRYDKGEAKSVIAAVKAMKPTTAVPVCIVIEDRSLVRPVVEGLLNEGIHVITVGGDDGSSPRAGHVGMSPSSCGERWNTARRQLFPKATNALFVFGSPRFKRERLEGAFFSTTLNVNTKEIKKSTNDLKYRTVSADQLTPKDLQWASVVTAIGEDALKNAVQLGAKNLLVVDSSPAAFDWAEGGVGRVVISANYYTVGQEAMKLAAERYTSFGNQNPINELDYDDSVETPLPELRKRILEFSESTKK